MFRYSMQCFIPADPDSFVDITDYSLFYQNLAVSSTELSFLGIRHSQHGWHGRTGHHGWLHW